jgi:DNA modification methylase
MTPYYEQSGITIYHGDCREVMPRLRADVLVTDPPYGINHASNFGASWNGTQIAHDADTSARDVILRCAPSMPAIVFGSWKQPRPLLTREVLIWDKGPNSGMGDLSFPWKRSWEEIYVIGDGFHGSRDEGVLKGYSVLTWESRGRLHPNMKPESLMAYLLAKCPPGIVIDPFAGSGTTLVAAKRLGRRAIGIEIEEKYCAIAATRLAQESLFTESPEVPHVELG